MDISPADEALLRKYLLGTLSGPKSDEIDLELFTNDDFAKTAEVIEDEIVDDYLDGTLSRQDRLAAERHFFHAPEHRSKLWFARLLRSHLQHQEQPVIKPVPIPWFQRPAFSWAMSLATVTLLVATVGLGVYTANLSRLLQHEKDDRQMAQADLDQERNRLGKVEAQLLLLQQETGGDHPATTDQPVAFNLMESERGPGVPELNQNVEIHIALVHGVLSSYQATLQSDADNRKIWSQTGLKPTGNQLIFTVPRTILPPGSYSLIIQGQGSPHQGKYPFVVR